MCLGFAQGELNNIQDNPTLHSTAPKSFLVQYCRSGSSGLREIVEELSANFAALDDPRAALREARLGAVAHDLSVP